MTANASDSLLWNGIQFNQPDSNVGNDVASANQAEEYNMADNDD